MLFLFSPLRFLFRATQALGSDVSPENALSVARFYEGQHELGNAGRFYRCAHEQTVSSHGLALHWLKRRCQLVVPLRGAVVDRRLIMGKPVGVAGMS